MIDPMVIVLSIIAVFVVSGGVLLIFAVVSNNRNNVETLEKANARLVEMRKEYNAHQENQEKNDG